MRFLTRIDYMRHAKLWFVITAVMMVLSLGLLIAKGFNLGVDFTGGTILTLQFDDQVTNAEVEGAFRGLPFAPSVQQSGEITGDKENVSEFFVRTPELTPEQRQEVLAALGEVGSFELVAEDQVSATVSKELTNQAILALVLAAILQMGYLWFRFELKFGVMAVVALIHDLVLTLGLVSLFEVEVNAPFVAAILTVLAYSINDTVIIFDRIRENLANRKKGEGLEALTTRSVQETVVRSMYTNITMQMVLVPLMVWGGETIRPFAITLFIGVTAGVYSSIFIAASAWMYWQRAAEKAEKEMAHKPAKV